jgi:hypothetical protein
MAKAPADLRRFAKAITQSGLTIYDPIRIGDPKLWIPSSELQAILDAGLRGISLAGLPLRTRSKVVKTTICRVLGYPIPFKFSRTKPRFPGQFFDTYVQKSNNLQVWNEQLAPSRRYVIIRVSDSGLITRVKVVTGDALAKLDTTGTLTQKFQARCVPGSTMAELVSARDTERLRNFTSDAANLGALAGPVAHPNSGQLFPIKSLFDRLRNLIGKRFADSGHDQERNRGAALHRLACAALGYTTYQDVGQFPDIRHQLLEVKLQTSPTIDLGLVCPDSKEALDVPQIENTQIRHCDVRYAIFRGRTNGREVTLTHLIVTTGQEFLSRFPLFGGRVLNKKLQIPLPADFFDT